jgi:hypothetical protein
MTQNIDSSDTLGKPCGLSKYGKVLVILAIIGWLWLFTAGIVVNSQPYRARIIASEVGNDAPGYAFAWLMTILSFTPTNVLLMALLTGLLGALGRCATLHALSKKQESSEDLFPTDPINPYLSGIIRGFFTYLLIISGFIIVSATIDTPFISTTPQQYVRFAGIISLASFIVGYNPRSFEDFFKRFWGSLKSRETQKN